MKSRTKYTGRMAGVMAIAASALGIGAISLGVVESSAGPAAPATAATKSQQLTEADTINGGSTTAVIRSAGAAQDVRRALEAEIPQAPGTEQTIAAIGWDKAVGFPRDEVAFVAQFRAACGWWERAAGGATDAATTRVLGQLGEWSALRDGPSYQGKPLVATISRGLTSPPGSAERAEAERLYTVNCVNPRAGE